MSRKSGEEYLAMLESWVVASGQSAAIVAFFAAYSALLKGAGPGSGRKPRPTSLKSGHGPRNDISEPR